jgi:hypothetical protein
MKINKNIDRINLSMESADIDVEVLEIDESENKVKIVKTLKAVQLNLDINNPIILLENISKDDLKKFIGKCEYRFRKGVGYKGEIFRLKFKEIKDGKAYFYRFKKDNRKLKVDRNSIIEIDCKELKYIYPLVLSPEITDNGLQWKHNYIIFPYSYGSKQPLPKNKLEKEAPSVYNYLFSYQKEILQQSRYNKRIQNTKEFYGLIRVGGYTFSPYFVAMRDNTELTSCIVEWITTDWGEKKNPIFDNHISYTPVASKEEAEYLLKKIREPKLKKLAKLFFDTRSIGSRVPFKIPKYIK